MTRRCWTCDTIIEDAKAIRCERQHCQAKHDVERDATADQKRRWAQERAQPTISHDYGGVYSITGGA